MSLTRGRLDEPIDVGKSPVDVAREYIEAGADWLQIVDLNGAAEDGDNDAVVRDILKLAKVPTQVGGGVRTLARAQELFDAGATRVILGTAAVADPDFLRQCVTAHPRQVVVSMDVWQGRVAIQGWKVSTSYEPLDYIKLLNRLDLAAIVITDIDRDVDLPESSLALTMQLAEQAAVPVIASGVIKTLDDISTVRYLPNIAGAVVGRALNTGAFTLAEALAIARQ